MHQELKKTIESTPSSPGVYQFYDIEGKLLYVGKAKKLKNRVKSYFKFTPTLAPSSNLSLRIFNMISKAHTLTYIKVESEHDALVLENSLIKQLKPKYNILLRDDKTYPYIYIDLGEEFPRFEITRKIRKGKNIKYFGPFSFGARDILKALYLLFPLVQKKGCLKGKKACLFHQIDRCLAPCENKITIYNYKEIIKESIKNIHQRTPLLKLLTEKMNTYALNEHFERAAEIRDMIRSIQNTKQENFIDLAKAEDFDLFAVFITDAIACSIKFFIREGKITSTTNSLTHSNNGFDIEELYKQMILSFYKKESPMPINTIYIADTLQESDEIAHILASWHNKKITIKSPQRGEKYNLTKMALTNAQEIIRLHVNNNSTKIQNELQTLFELHAFPQSIEVFDNSHLGGVATVGAIVTWEKDSFKKESYRHYHLQKKDEYAQMREILTQRAQRFEKESPPDLWVIDGGKTLLNLALDIIESSGANVDVIAISKEKVDAKSHRAKGSAKDIIHTKQRAYNLSSDDKRLQFIQKLRDEAHRFAISFHRKTKLKLDKESSKLQKAGLSEAKIKKLLLYFGTFEAIYEASFSEVEKVIGKNSTIKIKNYQKQ